MFTGFENKQTRIVLNSQCMSIYEQHNVGLLIGIYYLTTPLPLNCLPAHFVEHLHPCS